MSFTEVLGWIATAVTVIGVVAPKRQGLHAFMSLANGLWLAYGLLRTDYPLVTVSAILVVMHLWARGRRS